MGFVPRWHCCNQDYSVLLTWIIHGTGGCTRREDQCLLDKWEPKNKWIKNKTKHHSPLLLEFSHCVYMEFSIPIISVYMHTEKPWYLYLCVHNNYISILVSDDCIIFFAGACDVYFLQHEAWCAARVALLNTDIMLHMWLERQGKTVLHRSRRCSCCWCCVCFADTSLGWCPTQESRQQLPILGVGTYNHVSCLPLVFYRDEGLSQLRSYPGFWNQDVMFTCTKKQKWKPIKMSRFGDLLGSCWSGWPIAAQVVNRLLFCKFPLKLGVLLFGDGLVGLVL